MQAPLRHAGQLADQATKQLRRDLPTRRYPRELEQEDRCVRGGAEARDDRGREELPQLPSRCRAAQPACGRVDVVELALVDGADECDRGHARVVEGHGSRLGRRRTRSAVAVAQLHEPPTRVGARRRLDVGEQGGASDELERRVEHERVGRLAAGRREDGGDGLDERRVGCARACVVGGESNGWGRQQPVTCGHSKS